MEKEGRLEKGHEEFYNKVYYKNGRLRDTPEAQVIKEHIEYNKYIRSEFEKIMRLVIPNDAKYEQFLKKNGIKWQDPNTYVPQIITQQFKDVYPVGSIKTSKLIDKLVLKIAADEAVKKYPNLSEIELQKKLSEFKEYAFYEAQRRVYNAQNHGDNKSISKFFLPKKANFPEFWTPSKTGKRIQIFETNYSVIERMASQQSLYLANLEWFPEHVKLKGFKFSGPDSKTMLQTLTTTNPKWAEYIDRNLRAHMGIGERGKRATPWDGFGRILRPAAQILAKTLLMYYTSGIKNFLLGETGSLHAYGPIRTLHGNVEAINHQNRMDMIKAGVRTIGVKHIMAPTGIFKETSKLNKITKIPDKLIDEGFNYISWMKQTESLNRYTSSLASIREQHKMVRILQDYDPKSKQYKRMKYLADNRYRLTENEIDLLIKYGMGEAEGSGLEGFEGLKVRRQLQNIHQKMITAGHIVAQGSSQEMFMPEWTSGRGIKESTLFLRYAYQATVNAVDNTKIAFKSRNMPEASVITAMYLAGTMVTGASMIGLNKFLLGKPMPQENDELYDKTLVVLKKGEFLGFVGPYSIGIAQKGVEGIFNPDSDALFNVALYSVAKNYGAIIVGLLGDKLKPGQAFDDLLTTSSSLYRNAKSIKERRLKFNSYNKNDLDNRAFYNDFLKKMNPGSNDEWQRIEASTIDKEFRDLRTEWALGTNEEFIEQYHLTLVALTHKYYQEAREFFNEKESVRPLDKALEQAIATLKTKIKGLNPNKGSWTKGGKGEAERVTRKRNEMWLDYLSGDGPIEDRKYIPEYKIVNGKKVVDIDKAPEKIKTLMKTEVQYLFKKRTLFDDKGYLLPKWKKTRWVYTDTNGKRKHVWNVNQIPKGAKNVEKIQGYDFLKAFKEFGDWKF